MKYETDHRWNESAAISGTCGAAGSTDLIDALREANRHIEALAAVRKDNTWDMLWARLARDKILNAMSNASVGVDGKVDGGMQPNAPGQPRKEKVE